MNNFIVPARGTDTAGLVAYLFGPGRFNEHENQRVIAAAETLGVADGTRLDVTVDADRAALTALGAELDSHRKAMGVEMPDGHVWHCALSLPAGEFLTDGQWAEAARFAVARMGFDESSGKAPSRWIAVHHGRSVNGNEHLHLAVNLVREDGTFASTWRDRKTMSRVCGELERRFGLSVVEGRSGAGMPGLSRAELARAARTAGAPEPERIRLARIVRGCAIAAGSEADFVRRLRQANVAARPRYAAGGRNEVVGYSVALRGNGGTRPLWFGGGRLARDLTLTRLREHWKTSPSAVAEAVAEWSRGRGFKPPPMNGYRADSWEQAAAVVDRTRRELAEVAAGDVAVWAGAARQASGVLAVWSMRLETRGPGPMAAAADLLARSAQTPTGAPRARRTGRVRDLRGVAMVVAAASRQGDGAASQLLVMRQLIRLVEAIAEMHRAQGQVKQAAALAASARTGLVRFQHDLRPETMMGGLAPARPPAPGRSTGPDFGR